ncbi:GGDEF domain-containing protein [Mycolicibacterium bacteremicum]|nr:GGDEF domain-containing protein [Mycolicibacterium bacteremicum]
MRGVGDRWGGREYRFATGALREGRFMRVFMFVAGLGCLGLAVLGLSLQDTPQGPGGVVDRGLQALFVVAAIAVGVRWWRGPWPTFGQSVCFVVWADIACAVMAATMSTPTARLAVTPYIGLVGVFAGFILGSRILRLHCAFGAALIAGIVLHAEVFEAHRILDLYLYFMPALTWAVGVPLVGSILIDLGRRAIERTARSAHYDALTGLRNRRGMYSSIGRAVARDRRTTIVMAVFDIDRFKQLNDDGGHAAGDAALVAFAARLRGIARPDEITARLGGDELVLVAFGTDVDPMPDLVDRVSTLTGTAGSDFTVSIGIAAMSAGAQHFSIDDLLRHADSAMYESKRAGGATCTVHAMASTTAATAARDCRDHRA